VFLCLPCIFVNTSIVEIWIYSCIPDIMTVLNQTGNVHTILHWEAFVQTLLLWKGNEYKNIPLRIPASSGSSSPDLSKFLKTFRQRSSETPKKAFILCESSKYQISVVLPFGLYQSNPQNIFFPLYKTVLPNRRAAARYRALASIIPDHERLAW
jgi:hypothetical protein